MVRAGGRSGSGSGSPRRHRGVVALGALLTLGVGLLPTPAGASTPAGADRATPPAETVPAPVHYVVEGALDDFDGPARTWTVDRADGPERIAGLAEALGLSGRPARTATGWEVVGAAGTLTVANEAGSPWTFTAAASGDGATAPPPDRARPDDGDDRRPSRWRLNRSERWSLRAERLASVRAGTPAPEGSTEQDGDPSVDCPMPPCPPGMACIQMCPPRGAPAAPVETEPAAPVLAAAGVDIATGEVTRTDVVGGVEVRVAPSVGGLPTSGYDAAVTVAPNRSVLAAGGFLASPEAGPEYERIGTAAALERLRAGDGWGPPHADGPTCDGCAKPETVIVHGVRPGLVHLAGAGVLAPAYLFDVELGGRRTTFPVAGIATGLLPERPGPGLPPGCELIGGDAVYCPDGDGDEPGDDGHDGTCASEARGTLTLEVCVSPPMPTAGEEVAFTVTATDSAEAVADDCASPLFYAEATEDVLRCMIAFEPPAGAGPDSAQRRFTHVYEDPGRRTAAVSVNESCTPGGPCAPLRVEVALEVGR